MANVDPNEVIQDLAAQLAQKDIALSMTRIALRNTETELDAANKVIAKHKMAEPAPDGQ
jgi:hypothetical protein